MASEPLIGQIQAFGFNFAPRGWARCEGQIISISQNTALFALLGTIYGGDGETTFALPDLRGRASLHFGQGQGLTNRAIGERGGVEGVALSVSQIPSHTHTALGSNDEAGSVNPDGNVPATTPGSIYSSGIDATMNGDMVGLTGGSQAHNNMQPYLVINWCIALVGTFPS